MDEREAQDSGVEGRSHSLRAIAVIVVFIHHLNVNLPGRFVGVDVFRGFSSLVRLGCISVSSVTAADGSALTAAHF